MKTPARTHLLVGCWFHSFEPLPSRAVQWQGQVVGEVSDGVFWIQLYDWIVGAPGDRLLWPLTGMLGWAFYDTNEAMHEAYEARLKHRRAPERRA